MTSTHSLPAQDTHHLLQRLPDVQQPGNSDPGQRWSSPHTPQVSDHWTRQARIKDGKGTWKRLLRTSTRSSSSMYSHTFLYSVCMLSGALQKNSGVSSTVLSRLTAAFCRNTLPMSCAISLRDSSTLPAQCGSTRSAGSRPEQVAGSVPHLWHQQGRTPQRTLATMGVQRCAGGAMMMGCSCSLGA